MPTPAPIAAALVPVPDDGDAEGGSAAELDVSDAAVVVVPPDVLVVGEVDGVAVELEEVLAVRGI